MTFKQLRKDLNKKHYYLTTAQKVFLPIVFITYGLYASYFGVLIGKLLNN